jgi:nucleotide-binding universal stress UspA family protein
MTKIIAAFDGLKYSEVTTAYALDIAKQCNAHLVGISLEDFTYRGFALNDIVDQKGFSEKKMKELIEEDKKTRKVSSLKFEEACRNANIPYTIHHDKNIALKELLHESIYADLLIIDSKETLTKYKESKPTRFITDLLADVQCPVLLVTREYKPIQKIALLFDGEPSAVYAIKMFSYLGGSLKKLPTEVITVKEDGEKSKPGEKKLMDELMRRHFPETQYVTLSGDAETEIVKYQANQKQHTLIVAGAYRRGAVSRWFRPSMADALMISLKYPIFIAHNKG